MIGSLLANLLYGYILRYGGSSSGCALLMKENSLRKSVFDEDELFSILEELQVEAGLYRQVLQKTSTVF